MPQDAPDLSGSGSQETFQISHHSADEFVSRKDLDMLSNQLEEKFARFKALLSRTNIFSTPKAPVTTMSAPVSDQPFFDPGPDGDHVQKKNKGPGKKSKKTKTLSASSLPPVPDNPLTGDTMFIQPPTAAKVDELKLNPDKTEFIVFGAKDRHKWLSDSFPVNILGNCLSPADVVRNLGVMFDAKFCFTNHVNSVIKSCFISLRDLHRIRRHTIVCTSHT